MAVNLKVRVQSHVEKTTTNCVKFFHNPPELKTTGSWGSGKKWLTSRTISLSVEAVKVHTRDETLLNEVPQCQDTAHAQPLITDITVYQGVPAGTRGEGLGDAKFPSLWHNTVRVKSHSPKRCVLGEKSHANLAFQVPMTNAQHKFRPLLLLDMNDISDAEIPLYLRQRFIDLLVSGGNLLLIDLWNGDLKYLFDHVWGLEHISSHGRVEKS